MPKTSPYDLRATADRFGYLGYRALIGQQILYAVQLLRREWLRMWPGKT